MPESRSLEEWADWLAAVADNQGVDETLPSIYDAAMEALRTYAAQVAGTEGGVCEDRKGKKLA